MFVFVAVTSEQELLGGGGGAGVVGGAGSEVETFPELGVVTGVAPVCCSGVVVGVMIFSVDVWDVIFKPPEKKEHVEAVVSVSGSDLPDGSSESLKTRVPVKNVFSGITNVP